MGSSLLSSFVKAGLNSCRPLLPPSLVVEAASGRLVIVSVLLNVVFVFFVLPDPRNPDPKQVVVHVMALGAIWLYSYYSGGGSVHKSSLKFESSELWTHLVPNFVKSAIQSFPSASIPLKQIAFF